MTPDSALVGQVRPSPNFGERRGGAAVDTLVLHYTGMADADSALRWLTIPESQVSCHYVVREDGAVVQLVAERHRAWHAGAGRWRGDDDVNSRSLGIEIVHPGHAAAAGGYPAAQVAAVIALCRDCLTRHGVPPARLLAHSDTAPARKRDPGEFFPWEALFKAGLGHRVEPAPLGPAGGLSEGDAGPAVLALQERLADYGYDLDRSGRFDAPTRLATLAFQRHFRPDRVDGVADASTLDTLERLLAALPGGAGGS